MRSSAANNKFYINMLILHIIYGFAIYLYRPIAMYVFLAILFSLLFVIIDRKNKGNEALMAAAYIAGGEIFFRQTDALFFYETGKYMVIIYLVVGMFFKGSSSKTVPYWIYLLILFPGIVVASLTLNYEAEFRKLIAFNLSGPVSLGVSAIYCYYKKIKKEDFQRVLVLLLMPIIAQMFYLYFYTPSMDEVRINLSANYAASGGYGPNQISTIMGAGFFLLATRLFTIKNKWINFVDMVLLLMMAYRAIITFSRGGVVTGAVCILAFLIFFYYKQDRSQIMVLSRKMIGIVLIMFLGFVVSFMETHGLIENRYTNKDAAGKLKENISTGRAELIETELTAFYHHPVIGIGVGKGKEYRQEHLGIKIATHNEISRLLAEHGILGLLAIAILIFVPIVFWFKFKNNYYFLAFLAFWFLTINHSAMRIALPGFVYGLALLYIVDEKKNSVHRKRLTN